MECVCLVLLVLLMTETFEIITAVVARQGFQVVHLALDLAKYFSCVAG